MCCCWYCVQCIVCTGCDHRLQQCMILPLWMHLTHPTWGLLLPAMEKRIETDLDSLSVVNYNLPLQTKKIFKIMLNFNSFSRLVSHCQYLSSNSGVILYVIHFLAGDSRVVWIPALATVSVFVLVGVLLLVLILVSKTSARYYCLSKQVLNVHAVSCSLDVRITV